MERWTFFDSKDEIVGKEMERAGRGMPSDSRL